MVGARSLDLGLLIASYIAQYHRHMLTADNNDAHRQVAYKMMDACTTTGNLWGLTLLTGTSGVFCFTRKYII